MRNILLILTLFAALLSTRETAAQTVTLKADTVTISCASSDTFLIPIRVRNFQNIGSFQFTLMWDTAKLDYAYTTPINPLLLGAGVDFDSNTTQINQGKIAFIWTKTTGASLQDDSVIFNLAFRRIGGSFASLMFVNTPVPVEVANVNADILPVVTETGGVKPIDDQAPTIFCPANVTVQGSGPTPVNGIAPDSISDNCAPVANIGWVSGGATTASQPNDPDASGYPFNIGLSTVSYTATDVGGNTATCSFTVTVELSITNDTLTIIAQNATTSCNQTVSINITALNFDSIGSLQFSLGWDPGVLQFSSVSNFNPALQLILGDNFNTAQTANGLLAFLWTANAPEGVTLPPGATLFTLNLNVQNSGTNSLLTFGDTPIIREAYSNASGTPEEIGAYWINGAVNVVDNIPPILECPENVSVDLPPGNTNVQVNGLEPNALLDNCPGTIGLAYVRTGATTGSGSGNANGAYNPGVTNITYTATDVAGNTTTCSFTVTVNAAGVLTLLIDSVEVDCQANGDTIAVNIFVENWDDIFGLQFQVEWDESVLQFDTFGNFNPGLNLTAADFGVTQTGNGILAFFAGGPSSNWPQLPDSSVLFTVYFIVQNAGGSSAISYTGFIEAINSSINTVPVTTVGGYFSAGADDSPPMVTCPQDISITIIGNECNTNVFIPLPVATDACSGVDSITRDPSSDVFSSGITPVTYTVTDSAGNSATCSLTVTVNDNTPPLFTNCPTGVSNPASGFSCQGQVNWQPPVASDPCGQANLTVTSNYTPDSIFPVGQTMVLYTVTDASGNSANCSFLVTIQDTAAPIITCPGNLTVSPDGSPNCGAVVNFDLPVGFDNCDTTVFITTITGDPSLPGDTFPAGTTILTWFAIDDADNESTCTFSITVVDNEAPVISCPDSILLIAAQDTCGAFAEWPDVTADDACDGAITPTSPFQSGQFFPIGTTVVTYTATDVSDNTSTCSFSVTVTESVPPIFIGCPLNQTVNLLSNDCDTVVFWDPPQATDNCLLESLTASHLPGTVFQAGTTVVTYIAEDAAGNTTVCSFSITAVDKIAPVLSNCPDNITVDNASPCGVVIDWPQPTATDNCTPDSALVIISPYMSGDTFYNGVVNVVIRVLDANNNSDSCFFTIVVNTSTPPSWINVPQDTVINGCPQTVTWTPPMPVGFCVLDTIFSTHQPGDTFPTGITEVVYGWVDSIKPNDTTFVNFTVTIGETEPPAINCPVSPIVVNVGGGIVSDPSEFLEFADTVAGCNGVQLEFGSLTATDNCGIASLLQTDGGLSGEVFPVGLDTLVFTALDSSGNSAVCQIAIEVQALPALNVISEPRLGCLNEPVTLIATSIPGATYTWTFGDQTLDDSDNSILISEFASADEGTYTVFANVNGCLIPSASTEVVLAAAPIAVDDTDIFLVPGDTIVFNILDNDILLPDSSDFDITSVGNLSGLINLGNGFFAYTGGRAGEFVYEICSKSCPDLCDEALVTIQLQEGCTVPNIFTPNGDGINDWLQIPCLGVGTSLYPNNSLVVYNQWGDKVYEASPYFNDDPQNPNAKVPWRGELNGNPGQDLPDATYFYIFKPGPGESAIKGFVEIFR